jgi:hypothetical protein
MDIHPRRETMTDGTERLRCPKCGGNIFFDKDCYGWFEKCICCGWSRDLPGIELNTSDKLRHGGRSSPVPVEKHIDRPLGQGADKKQKTGGD